jgi:TonB family protein
MQVRLEPPSVANRSAFETPLSAGQAIQQAARAAAAGRMGGARIGGGGEGGDYGMGGRGAGRVNSDLDIMSDTMGVDFGPYLSRVLHDVRMNWYSLIPEVARAPLMKKGKVSIEFYIKKDGQVQGMRLAGPSGDVSLDRAAWGGITGSNPFPPLPPEFKGNFLALRFHFFYNPDRNEME